MKDWLETNGDYATFALVCAALFVVIEVWLRRRREPGRLPPGVWPLLAVLLISGFFVVRAGGRAEQARIRDFLQGVAPTYAREIELLGHASIGLETSPDDPVYLAILEAMRRWKQLNPVISDIYTYREDGGVVRLLVSGPTDYNRDGIISGEREQRVEIGTEYPEADPPMHGALRGASTFSTEPVRDEWGYWVSAQVPLRAEDGTVVAAMGLDYPARQWLTAIASGRRAMQWLLAIPVLMLGFGGTVVGVLRAELAARRRIEQSLLESETRLRGLFEHLPFPFWVSDGNGACRLFNQAAEEAYMLVEGGSLPAVCQSRQTEGQPVAEIVRERDGERRFFYRVRAPLTSGRLAGGEICLELDMTARHQAEMALRDSQERLARHVRQTPLAIIEWDLHLRVLSWNPSAARIFGHSEREAIGQNLLELVVAPADRPEVMARLMSMTVGGNAARITLTNRTRSGRIIQCDWYSTALMGEDGRLINVASHAEDITERAALERQLHDTRHLESLGQLAGGVAHEFNNLLTPMLIQIGLIEQARPADNSLRELIKPLESSVLQAAQLTQRVLAVGRKISDEEELLMLNDLVADTVALLRKTMDRRVELRVELDTKLPAIWVSRSAITQIVMNLMLNARDTLVEKLRQPPLPTWQALILIRTHQSEPDAPSAQFVTVSDNGMGMDREQRARIFEPFYTTKPPGAGTGLGRAVLWNAVKSLGGSVEVKSVRGAGSSFSVMLPRRRRSDLPPPSPHPQSSPPFVARTVDLTVPSAPVPLRVLLVDDTPLVVDSLRAVLVAGGHQITCAVDGEEAWTQFVDNREDYDVVVTDLNMPRLSGEGLLQRLRGHGRRVGVIVLSGHLDAGQETRLREIGADRLLRKPIRPVELLVAVTTVGAEIRRARNVEPQA
ncbi:MAG: PAS domain S-box protein [Verrucomicrobiota bacterium]